MLAKAIKEWLAEYKCLTDEELHTFACTVRENKPLIDSLHAFFESRPSFEDLDPVCHQLFEFYRSREVRLRLFALEFVPSLTWLYLRCLSHNDKKNCAGLEAFLLGAYNLEIVKKDGSPAVKNFRVPSIGQASIYHELQNMSTLALTESALSRYNRTDEIWQGGPHPHYETVNGQNRQAVLTHLIQVYNTDIAQLLHHSHYSLCIAASRITTTGLPNLNVTASELQSWPVSNGPRPSRSSTTSQKQPPRMTVSPALLVELLWGVNFAMYNGCSKVAKQAVQDVHARASYELLPDVLLVTQAILNSERLGVSTASDDGPMGIALSVPTYTSVSKFAITNASFKTKKLPDDISVVPERLEGEQARLSPITEEENKAVGKQGQRASKGKERKEREKEKSRGKDRRDSISDTGSIKSVIVNGEGLDNVSVAVVKSQSKTTVDVLELRPVNHSRHNSSSVDHTHTSNGNNSAAQKPVERGSGESHVFEAKSRPSSLTGAMVNPESYSTDL